MSLTSTFLYSFSIPKCPISSSSSLTSREFAATSQVPTGIRFRRGGAGRALDSETIVVFLGTGFTLALLGPALAYAGTELQSSLMFNEPQNALSLPTWAIHVSIVVEWITAMALVWQYGEKSGNESWKGLSWGMVLVALQAMLTAIGNATMCIAAFRIYKSSLEWSKNL